MVCKRTRGSTMRGDWGSAIRCGESMLGVNNHVIIRTILRSPAAEVSMRNGKTSINVVEY